MTTDGQLKVLILLSKLPPITVTIRYGLVIVIATHPNQSIFPSDFAPSHWV